MIHGIVSVFIIPVAFIVYAEIRKIYIKRKLGQFESPKQMPILGMGGKFLRTKNEEIVDTVLDLFDEVKSTPFQAWFGPVLLIGVSEPEDIQTIVNSENALNKPYFYDHFQCKTSLIVTNREIWRPSRRELNKAFSVKMLQSFVPIMNEKSRILVKLMEPYQNKAMNFYRKIFICMMDMISRTTAGEELHLQSERGEIYFDRVKIVMNNIMWRVVRFWLRFEWVYKLTKVSRDEQPLIKTADDLFEEVYRKKIEEMELLKSEGIDYLQELEERNAMTFLDRCLRFEVEGIYSHQNLIDQMRVIVFAGIDTSSIAAFATLLMLAINQKHQELVVEELRSVLETVDCDVTQSHLANLKYLERVIKETLRLIPPVPFFARKPSADIQLAKGIVPKNSIVLINIMHMHRNPKIWGENALEFDPDRFLPENVAKRLPHSYIPFSNGPRNCIGMKYAMNTAKIILAHLLRRYKYTTDLKFDEIKLNTHLVTEVVNENPLRIQERNF